MSNCYEIFGAPCGWAVTRTQKSQSKVHFKLVIMTVKLVSSEVTFQMQLIGICLHSSSGDSSKCVIELPNFWGIGCYHEFIMGKQLKSIDVGSPRGQLRVN